MCCFSQPLIEVSPTRILAVHDRTMDWERSEQTAASAGLASPWLDPKDMVFRRRIKGMAPKP